MRNKVLFALIVVFIGLVVALFAHDPWAALVTLAGLAFLLALASFVLGLARTGDWIDRRVRR